MGSGLKGMLVQTVWYLPYRPMNFVLPNDVSWWVSHGDQDLRTGLTQRQFTEMTPKKEFLTNIAPRRREQLLKAKTAINR